MLIIVYFVIFAGFYTISTTLPIAFLFGILVSFWDGDTLGKWSLMYVILVYAVHLYKRKYNAQSPGFLVIASTLASIIYEMVESKSFYVSSSHIVKNAGVSFLCVFIWVVLYKIWDQRYGERKLPV